MKKILLTTTLYSLVVLGTGCTSISDRTDTNLCYLTGYYYQPNPVKSFKFETEYMKRNNKVVSEECAKHYTLGVRQWSAKVNNDANSNLLRNSLSFLAIATALK